jgi:pimeloyl-ACP methyl ester carboxylesterase
MVAQEIAVTAPERIERLALICTSAGGAGGSSYPLHDLLDLDPKERLARSTLLLDTRFDDAWLADHPRDRAMIEFRDAQASVPRSTEQLRGERLQIEARSHHDVWDRLPRITCPTMVAGGRYDGIAPPANSEAIASRLPDAQLRLYEGGHLFVVQDPAALPDIVTFLSG